MPDVNPVCAAEHAQSRMHGLQTSLRRRCRPDLGPFLSCRQSLEEIYVTLKIITIIKTANMGVKIT